MKLTQINAEQWKQVKEIYMEAFPKAERKPFFCSAPFGEKQKGADSDGNRGRNFDGICHGHSLWRDGDGGLSGGVLQNPQPWHRQPNHAAGVRAFCRQANCSFD